MLDVRTVLALLILLKKPAMVAGGASARGHEDSEKASKARTKIRCAGQLLGFQCDATHSRVNEDVRGQRLVKRRMRAMTTV